MVRDFDDNKFPLAYLISFRTYGTWLHGDERGSVNRRRNKYGTPRIEPNPRLSNAERQQLKHPPVKLNARQRPAVEKAIREVCDHRRYLLRAINVRTNHVHTVVTAALKPEPILQAFQAYATRKLRRDGLLPGDCQTMVSPRQHTLSLERATCGKGDRLCSVWTGRRTPEI